jgi:hypothetical protein
VISISETLYTGKLWAHDTCKCTSNIAYMHKQTKTCTNLSKFQPSKTKKTRFYVPGQHKHTITKDKDDDFEIWRPHVKPLASFMDGPLLQNLEAKIFEHLGR